MSGILIEIHRIRTRRRILLHLEVVGRQAKRFQEHIAEVLEFAQHFGFQFFVALIDFGRQTNQRLAGLRNGSVQFVNGLEVLETFV